MSTTANNLRQKSQSSDPRREGQEAWSAGKGLQDNPYEWMSPHDAADEWDEGWHEARRDNGQFGVGA